MSAPEDRITRRAQRKLAFVNRYFDPDESATSQMLTDLARGLAAGGLTVHVICSRQRYTDADARLPPRELRFGVVVHRVATTRFGRARLLGRAADYASFYLSSGLELLRLLAPGDVVIAKTDPPLISVICTLVARLRGATLVTWQQDVFPEVASHLTPGWLPGWLDRLVRSARNWSMRRAQLNVVISPGMRDHFLARGLAAEQLKVIENWADGARVAAKPSAASELRRRLELEDRFVVGYSGNLGRAHEFDTLLGAAEALRDDPSVVFLVIGGGARMAALTQAVAQRALQSFRFLPYQPRESLGDSLAAADVHLISLLPALEGLILPSKLYGILAAGRPIAFIGDAHGDIARVVCDAGVGVQVDVGHGADLAAALRRLRDDPMHREAMGVRARQLFMARYTLAQAVERWRAALELILEGRAAAAEPRAP